MKISKTKDGQLHIDLLGQLKNPKVAIASTIAFLLLAGGAVLTQQMSRHGLALSSLLPRPRAERPESAPTQQASASDLQADRAKQRQAINDYRAGLATIDGMDLFVQKVEPGMSPGRLHITVTDGFQAQSRDKQLEMAELLTQAWIAAYQPGERDSMGVSLLSPQGVPFGGFDSFRGLHIEE